MADHGGSNAMTDQAPESGDLKADDKCKPKDASAEHETQEETVDGEMASKKASDAARVNDDVTKDSAPVDKDGSSGCGSAEPEESRKDDSCKESVPDECKEASNKPDDQLSKATTNSEEQRNSDSNHNPTSNQIDSREVSQAPDKDSAIENNLVSLNREIQSCLEFSSQFD